ncbi:MAG: hypothetical protein BGO43_09025 [Gammaproteobacteria bacterium 39-13]|nr:DUF1835 domain-containing protein [Gammaproteobacteria bacterium]OJV94382.1 MAG: hypothetical protein BGO43_09025 [Gammaproteobacteria bacterium 39-13]
MKLHITNGDNAAELIEQSYPEAEVIAWRDVLHEGPVPSLPLRELNKVRAQYLAEKGYGDYQIILNDAISNLHKLEDYRHYDEIILWFEHDLYDQLQLIQVLHWFSTKSLSKTHLSFININQFAGVSPFYGFGQLSVDQMSSLFPHRQPITSLHLELGKMAWEAFTNKNPQSLVLLLETDLSLLPFLKNAMIRHLQEFPSSKNGLNRTEQFILTSLKRESKRLSDIFWQLPVDEGTYYMGLGDISFWSIVKRLDGHKNALLHLDNVEQIKNSNHHLDLHHVNARITDLGRKILTQQADWIDINGIDRWLGGAHLTSHHHWRWNENELVEVLK